jgi:methyltransferase (TIGR00027 family)
VDGSAASSTARGVALVRAHLTDRGLLDDPHAERFLDDRGRRLLRLLGRVPMRGRSFSWLAARIRAFDELVASADERQVVVLGAGYDARAWRFARDDVRFWEVDHPATQATKRRLGPSGGPTYVPVDLAAEPAGTALAEAGLDPSVPTLFVAEGLVMYLADDELVALLAGLAPVAAAGSRVGFNIGVGFDAGSGVGRRVGRRLLARSREPIRSTVTPDDVAGLVDGTGWQVVDVQRGPELARRQLAGTGMNTAGVNAGSALVVAERNPGATPR